MVMYMTREFKSWMGRVLRQIKRTKGTDNMRLKYGNLHDVNAEDDYYREHFKPGDDEFDWTVSRRYAAWDFEQLRKLVGPRTASPDESPEEKACADKLLAARRELNEHCASIVFNPYSECKARGGHKKWLTEFNRLHATIRQLTEEHEAHIRAREF